jgi:hypothetical protein
MTIFQVIRDLLRRPGWHISTHWNWKTAIMSVAFRSSVFFVTNVAFGFRTATKAWLVDAVFRVPLVGIYGAIGQAFTDAQPAWAASTVVMIGVPLLARAIEFVIHWIAGTPQLMTGVIVSLACSAVSNPFTLFAMRRGALVVGVDGEDSLWRDVSRLPRIAVDFVSRVISAMTR